MGVLSGMPGSVRWKGRAAGAARGCGRDPAGHGHPGEPGDVGVLWWVPGAVSPPRCPCPHPRSALREPLPLHGAGGSRLWGGSWMERGGCGCKQGTQLEQSSSRRGEERSGTPQKKGQTRDPPSSIPPSPRAPPALGTGWGREPANSWHCLQPEGAQQRAAPQKTPPNPPRAPQDHHSHQGQAGLLVGVKNKATKKKATSHHRQAAALSAKTHSPPTPPPKPPGGDLAGVSPGEVTTTGPPVLPGK